MNFRTYCQLCEDELGLPWPAPVVKGFRAEVSLEKRRLIAQNLFACIQAYADCWRQFTLQRSENYTIGLGGLRCCPERWLEEVSHIRSCCFFLLT